MLFIRFIQIDGAIVSPHRLMELRVSLYPTGVPAASDLDVLKVVPSRPSTLYR